MLSIKRPVALLSCLSSYHVRSTFLASFHYTFLPYFRIYLSILTSNFNPHLCSTKHPQNTHCNHNHVHLPYSRHQQHHLAGCPLSPKHQNRHRRRRELPPSIQHSPKILHTPHHPLPIQWCIPHRHWWRRELPQLRRPPGHPTRRRNRETASEKRERGFELALWDWWRGE
jgi:hypothetical protein